MGAWPLAALFFAVALWPAIVSGGALWFDDLSPYAKGGHAAIEAVFGDPASPSTGPLSTSSLSMAPPSTGPPSTDPRGGARGDAGAGLVARTEAPVSGVRSIAYSLAAYLAGLPLPRFWGLALAQALALGGLLALFVQRERGPVWAYVALLAVSAGPVSASTASPDVWAGLLLLGVLVLVRHGAGLRPASLVFVGACVAFAVAAHASHLLLGGALAAFAWVWPLVTGAGRKPGARKGGGRAGGALIGAVVALGAAGVVATSVVGFGEASLAPKRYPIVLARAIEDGPALWHLEEHCDDYEYAVCEVFPDGIPSNVGSFLWDEGGLRDRATPAQMDRVRAEEALIIRRAAAEYPFFQLREAFANFAEQAVLVAAPPRLGVIATLEAGDAARAGRLVSPGADRLLVLGQALCVAASALVLLALLALRYRRPSRADWQLLALTACGLLANAAICGVLSVPDPRYQARIAWVLPLVCVALLSGRPRSPGTRDLGGYAARGGLDAG